MSLGRFLQSIVALSLGSICGIGLLYLLAFVPFAPDNPVYTSLGIRKQYVIGFLPYWLLAKADKNYGDFTNTQTYFGLGIDTDGSLIKLANKTQEEPGWNNLRIGNVDKHFGNPLFMRRSLLVFASDNEHIAKLLSNPAKHAQALIRDAAPLMRQYGFNDLNIDIESFSDKKPEEQKRFTEFLREIKKQMTEKKLGTLTVEISPTALVKSYLINVTDIAPIADYVVLMAYDYHYSGSYIAGPVAPLNGTGKTREFDVETGIQEAVKVIPQHKIILGIPLYGYEWETLSNVPGSPVIPGSGATASNRRVSTLLNECKDCMIGTDEFGLQPYVIYQEKDTDYYKQIFYEDKESLNRKVDTAKKYNLGGVALWAIGYEGNDMLTPLKDYKNITSL